MTDPRPLTTDQRRAAVLMAQGRMQSEIAEEIGCVERTIGRWSSREDFRAIVREHREALVPGTASATATLESALSATKSNGEPDWQNRVAAAKAILSSPIPDADAHAAAERVERIYIGPGGDTA